MQAQAPVLTDRDTFSRCVSSCSALYCATTDLTTSLPMEGSTRSSQSTPSVCSHHARSSQREPATSNVQLQSKHGSVQTLKMLVSLPSSGFDRIRSDMFTICRSAQSQDMFLVSAVSGRPTDRGVQPAKEHVESARRSPLVPVTELMVRGRVRMSMRWGVWTHGILKCVPSPTGSASTPRNLSKMTARSPPSTAWRSTACACEREWAAKLHMTPNATHSMHQRDPLSRAA